MNIDQKTESNIRLSILLVPTGQNTLQRLLLKISERLGFSSFDALLNYPQIKEDISSLRRNRELRSGRDFVHRKQRLTKRQWHVLYQRPHRQNQTGLLCNVDANINVLETVDICLAFVLLNSVFKDKTSIPEDVLRSAEDLSKLKCKVGERTCVEKEECSEDWKTAEESILSIASFVREDYRTKVISEINETKTKPIQELINPSKENYHKLRMLLLEPGQRLLRSVFNVSLTRAGFKNREEMFANEFVQSEVVRKIQSRSRNRVANRHPERLIRRIFDVQGLGRTLKESVKQCIASFDIGLLYILMKDLSFLQFELSPYTREGTFSFIKGLRDMYGNIVRGFALNEMTTSEFNMCWEKSCDALKALMRYTGSWYTEEIQEIHNMEFHCGGIGSPRQLLPLMFRVRLEFPPPALSDYEFARTRIIHELRRHEKETQSSLKSKFDVENHDLVFVHYDKKIACDTCAVLFDAEPVLEEIDDSTTEFDCKNPVVCLVDPCVHRLPDCLGYLGVFQKITISQIMERIGEERYDVFLDMKYSSESEKKALYDALYKVFVDKLKPLLSTIQIPTFTKTLRQFIELCEERKPRSSLKISDEFENWLYSEIPGAIQCFSISDKIKIYIKGSERERLLSTILKHKFASKSDVDFVVMNNSLHFLPLFKPGSHMYVDESHEHHGSIGLYGKLRSNDTLVAISHGHVIQDDKRAYVRIISEDEPVDLGRTTYPPFDRDESYISELAVIEVENERVKQLLEEAKKSQKQVKVFEGEVVELKNAKVVKYGATTQKTVGFMVETDFRAKYGDIRCEGIVIDEESQEKNFAKSGDSGALVFVPRRKDISAISLVFSEFKLKDHPNAVLTTKFSDCKNAFETKLNDKITLDGDHGLAEICSAFDV